MITIHGAYKNADQTEGRGPMVPIAFFMQPQDARRAARGQGVMGCGDGDVKCLEVYASFDEWQLIQSDEFRRTALAKLTPEERKALNL